MRNTQNRCTLTATYPVWIVVGLLISAVLSLSGCNSSATGNTATGSASTRAAFQGSYASIQEVSTLPAPPNSGRTNEPRISANDLLEITVFQVQGMDRTAVVNSEGKISMPLIGEVKAAGLTVKELELSLEAKYGKDYLQSPEITVFMKESAGQRVTVDGEFGKTGFLPIDSDATLMKVVAQVGGLTPVGDPEKIFVYRKYPDGTKVANYSISKIRTGQLRDPTIYGGDVIVSFPSGSKVALKNLKEALGITLKVAAVAAL